MDRADAVGTAPRRGPLVQGPARPLPDEDFGIRAIALGASYLLNDGDARRRSQRLAVLVDTADTVMAPFCGLPRQMVWRSVVITVPYAAVGWIRLLKDLQNDR